MSRFLNPLRRAWHPIKRSAKRLFCGGTYAQPEVIVIGAQKGGTTSLYHYLSLHPDIVPPEIKEIDYFNSLGTASPKKSSYHKRFPFVYGRNESALSIDISPAYMLDAEVVAPAIHAYNQKIKVVATIREPVARAVSAWFMYKKLWQINPNWFTELNWVRNRTNRNIKIQPRVHGFGVSFANDIQEEIDILIKGGRIDMPIVEYGLYERQLKPFYQLFGSDAMLVVDSSELSHQTQSVLNQITNFMGLSHSQLPEHSLLRHFVGDNKQPIPDAELVPLRNYYAQENTGLESLTGRAFEWLAKSENAAI